MGDAVRAGRDAPPPETMSSEGNGGRRHRRNGHAPMRRAREGAEEACVAADAGWAPSLMESRTGEGAAADAVWAPSPSGCG